MPQLDIFSYNHQIFYFILTFFFVYFIFLKSFLPHIYTTLYFRNAILSKFLLGRVILKYYKNDIFIDWIGLKPVLSTKYSRFTISDFYKFFWFILYKYLAKFLFHLQSLSTILIFNFSFFQLLYFDSLLFKKMPKYYSFNFYYIKSGIISFQPEETLKLRFISWLFFR